MKIPLSDRLLACCNYVKRGDRVADVGCDHGYLGIYLLTNGIAKSVIESDVAEGPLQSAMRNAVKYGTKNKMSFHLSDGVKDIPRDFDTLVCAGMGADTIMSIIRHSAQWLKDPKYRLILQCQSKRPELRRWLYDEGFRMQGDWALNIRSVIVFGRIHIIDDHRKALDLTRRLSRKYTLDEAYIQKEIDSYGHEVLVFALEPEHITGKITKES